MVANGYSFGYLRHWISHWVVPVTMVDTDNRRDVACLTEKAGIFLGTNDALVYEAIRPRRLDQR